MGTTGHAMNPRSGPKSNEFQFQPQFQLQISVILTEFDASIMQRLYILALKGFNLFMNCFQVIVMVLAVLMTVDAIWHDHGFSGIDHR